MRQQGLAGINVIPPSTATLYSLPSLLTGKPVKSAEQVGTDGLLIRYASHPEQAVGFKDERTVLADARDLGLNTGMFGWYHPYCRVISDETTTCAWEEMPFQSNSAASGFPRGSIDHVRSLFETTLLSPFGQSLAVKAAARRYRSLLDRAVGTAADPSYGLVFIHMQVPHGPHFYDRRTGGFTLANKPVAGYIDSLELADRTLAQFRVAMQRNDVWDCTTLLVSSDHGYRTGNALLRRTTSGRVPFLLKLAHHSRPAVYTDRFESVHSAALVLAILRGELRTIESVAQWMDSQRQTPSSGVGPGLRETRRNVSRTPDPA